MPLAEDFQEILDALPSDWTDMELDLRIAWRPTRALEAALVGQNLLHDHHAEFGQAAMRGEIQRAVYASLTWRR